MADDFQAIVNLATLGSVAFVAAGALANINASAAALHPSVAKALLISGLFFMLDAALFLTHLNWRSARPMPRTTFFIIRISLSLGTLSFLYGAAAAVWYFVL